MRAWGFKFDLMCLDNVAGSHHHCWHWKKEATFLPQLQRTVKINRQTPITLCLISINSRRKPPDILMAYSKCTRCFPSAPCNQLWHKHPFCCYCARASCSAEKKRKEKRLWDIVCSAGGAVSASGQANKQLWKRTAVVSDTFRGRTRRRSDSFLFEEAACSIPQNTISQGQRTLPRIDR